MNRPLRFLGLFLLMSSALNAAEPKKPNVLFIAVDDLNDWVGFLDGNRQTITPNLDRLAARGVKFNRAYCAAPLCNPSRAALMTGVRPFTSGVYTNGNDWRPVISEDLPLTTTFRKAGYHVAGAGKIYHEAFARRSEWDEYLPSPGKDPEPTGDTGVGGIKFAPLDCKDEDLREWKVVNFGIEQLQKKHDKSLFLAVGLFKPHMPWNVPRKYYDLHPLDKIVLPEAPPEDLSDVPPAGIKMANPNGDHKAILESGRWKEAVQAYLAAISFTDGQIGRLLDALDESPERDNTIIVLWGDHGWHLGEKQHWRKFTLWEEATRAPLIWVAPGVTKVGTASDRTVDFMSIYPTLTDLAGIPTPEHVEGQSIRALLANPQAEWSQHAVTTFGLNNHAVRTEGWRYIRYANGDEELYDETADPKEWTNLASRTEYAEKKAKLAALLPTNNAPEVAKQTAARGNRKQREGKTVLGAK
ncbi:sulfatase [Schlesneria paludicola]|uniref:sulfatase n=1 Tax=Schlesneria paludicola TaxID=360056 RepID=UPI00029A50BC|nr:sulfatase [Schlesneria paludicola]